MIDYRKSAEACYKLFKRLEADYDCISDDLKIDIEASMYEWEQAHQAEPDWPLPDWAERLNTGNELVEGTQLCTKDGRQRGNARIISVDRNNPVFPTGSVLYKVRTDIGSEMNLLAAEIEGMFYIGRYILKPDQ